MNLRQTSSLLAVCVLATVAAFAARHHDAAPPASSASAADRAASDQSTGDQSTGDQASAGQGAAALPSEAAAVATPPAATAAGTAVEPEAVSTIASLRADLAGHPSAELQAGIAAIAQEIEGRRLIERANQDELTAAERLEFDALMNKDAAMRLVLIDRQLKEIENSAF